MTDERVQHVEAVLREALRHTGSDRAAVLERAFAADPHLRQDVEAYVRRHGTHLDVLRPLAEETGHAPERHAAVPRATAPRAGLEPGSCIGRYRVVRRLGAGGMGEVLLADDPALRRSVAIKVLGERVAGRPRFQEHLQREAQAVARLNHPHIAQVYDVLEHEGRSCFVMELLEGETLAERLARGALDVQEVIRLGSQVADGLAHAHAHGVLHCDLKPSNVFLTTAGTAKLLDFGLARAADRGARAALESDPAVGARAGTPAYMAPEQYAGHSPDERSDVYSLGLVLAEMATGQRPAAAAVLAAGADAGHVSHASVAPLLGPIIARALAVDRDQRFASVRALREALAHAGDVLALERRRETHLAEPTPAWSSPEPAPVSSTLVRRVIQGAAWIAGGLAAVTLLGAINSATFNMTLGRQAFASETAADWLRWGAKSLVAPGVLCALLWIVLATVLPVLRFVIRRFFRPLSTRSAVLSARLGLDHPDVMARIAAAAGIAVLAAIYVRFSPLITAVMTYDLSHADAHTLAALAPDRFLEHRAYRLTLTVFVFAVGTVLVQVLRRRSRPTFSYGPVVALSAVLALAVLLLDVPYRILYQADRFEKVRADGHDCFLLATRGSDALVYCPASAPPRVRTRHARDGSLERLNCVGNVFDPSPGCGPVARP